MSIDRMPFDNLNEFVAAPHHPMAPDGYSVIPQIDRLGQQLQAFRLDQDLSQIEAAHQLDWGRSKILRIEGGQVTASVADVLALLAIYGVDDKAVMDPLVETTRANRKARGHNPYTDILGPDQQRYLGYEAAAANICLHASFVPDTLQTSGYAETLDTIFHAGRSPDESKLAMRLRRERAAYLLGKWGPPLQIIIDEAALRRPEAGPGPSQYAQLRIIIEGLKALNTAARELPANSELNPSVAIRVALFSSGTSPFVTYEHGILHMEGQRHAAVYSHTPDEAVAIFDANPDELTTQQQDFDQLSARLGSPEETNSRLDWILASLPS